MIAASVSRSLPRKRGRTRVASTLVGSPPRTPGSRCLLKAQVADLRKQLDTAALEAQAAKDETTAIVTYLSDRVARRRPKRGAHWPVQPRTQRDRTHERSEWCPERSEGQRPWRHTCARRASLTGLILAGRPAAANGATSSLSLRASPSGDRLASLAATALKNGGTFCRSCPRPHLAFKPNPVRGRDLPYGGMCRQGRF